MDEKEQLDLLKRENEVLKQKIDVIEKGIGMEFENIQKAFAQTGNLLDLFYLQITGLVDVLVEKKTFNREEFAKQVETVAEKVSAAMREQEAKSKEKESPIITKV